MTKDTHTLKSSTNTHGKKVNPFPVRVDARTRTDCPRALSAGRWVARNHPLWCLASWGLRWTWFNDWLYFPFYIYLHYTVFRIYVYIFIYCFWRAYTFLGLIIFHIRNDTILDLLIHGGIYTNSHGLSRSHFSHFSDYPWRYLTFFDQTCSVYS